MAMRVFWVRWSLAPWQQRWLTKGAILLAVIFFVFYPHPSLFVRHLSHLRMMDELPDPNTPALTPLIQRFDAFLGDAGRQIKTLDTKVLSQAVETFVYKNIPYCYDWDNWGVLDYLPTVSEVIASGKEDCDGRAVIAVALLRSKNVESHLVGNIQHVWISTPRGEMMSPAGKAVFRWDKAGLKVQWGRLFHPGPLAFGISIFPFTRESIILLTAWLLMLSPGVPFRWSLMALWLLFQGLMVIRLAGVDSQSPNMMGIVLGLISMLWTATMMQWLRYRYE